MWKPIILDVECIVCNKTLQKIRHDPREVSRKMVRITNRRSRTPNWSLDEKQYLLELIKEHKEVVVIKNNNGPNHSEEKDVAWNEILRKLAAKFGTKFTGFSIKKVKTQWQNMKRIAREEITVNGNIVENYSKQSLEVCNILDLIKDGILKKEDENFNEASMSTNIEIKTECIDEETQQPSFSGNNTAMSIEIESEKPNDITESSTSSVSEPAEIIDTDDVGDNQDERNSKKSTCSMPETPLLQDITNVLPFHREMEDFIKYSAAEKQLKMESLKEERQVFRAMRETAELNKIIAEQKLKHILWMKKREIS